jgi:hypothetical protein
MVNDRPLIGQNNPNRTNQEDGRLQPRQQPVLESLVAAKVELT